MWSTRCGGSLGACPGWKYMLPCGTTLIGGAGIASGVDSGVFTRVFYCCGLPFVGVVTCVGKAMLKISVSLFRATICLLPNVVSRLVEVGLRRVCVRSLAACVSTPFYDILDNVMVDGGKYVVSETRSLAILGIDK